MDAAARAPMTAYCGAGSASELLISLSTHDGVDDVS